MSDIIAIALIKGPFDINIYVPKYILIMGFDNIKISRYFIPELIIVD